VVWKLGGGGRKDVEVGVGVLRDLAPEDRRGSREGPKTLLCATNKEVQA